MRTCLLALLVAGAAPVARAAGGTTDLRMALWGVDVPVATLEAGAAIDDVPGPQPDLVVAASFRGAGPQAARWGAFDLGANLSPTAPSLSRSHGQVAVFRTIGETWPAPLAWDVEAGVGRLLRDDRLGIDLDASFSLIRVAGGFYFPAVDPGDFDGRLTAAVDLIGADSRRYLDGDAEHFVGGRIGGLAGEVGLGRMLTRRATLDASLHGNVGWSVGRSKKLCVVTDTRVALDLGLRVGPVGFDLRGGAVSTRDPGNDRAASFYTAEAVLRVAP